MYMYMYTYMYVYMTMIDCDLSSFASGGPLVKSGRLIG